MLTTLAFRSCHNSKPTPRPLAQWDPLQLRGLDSVTDITLQFVVNELNME